MPAPEVSVIMAAHNCGATLDRALESVERQTLDSWELIVIDDGSADDTPTILDRHALADHRIRAIHQGNAGISEVRRRGVGLARGEYVIHFDSDDYATPEMLADMLAHARRSGADITVADFFSDHPGGRIVSHRQRFDSLDATALTEALLDRSMHGALWNKLIRRDAYRRFGADFSENLSFGEDMVTIMKMLSKGATVSFIHKGYYHYCYNNVNSLTSSPTREGYDRRVRWIEACVPYAGERFKRHIDAKRFNAKFFGLIHGLVGRREFYSYGPNSPRWLPTLAGYRKYQPAMALATLGLYPFARLWCKAMHRLSSPRHQ